MSGLICVEESGACPGGVYIKSLLGEPSSCGTVDSFDFDASMLLMMPVDSGAGVAIEVVVGIFVLK